ncbi:hypothetical protein RCL1_002369 [Eukaryota sp. TZLM3-RCL]
MQQVRKTLEIDAKHRYVGVVDDLHPLSSLSSETWDFSLPTLTRQSNSAFDQVQLVTDISDFKFRFYQKYPLLKELNFENLVVAGGSVGNLISAPTGRGQGYTDNDVDVFIHGLSTPEQGNARVYSFIEDLKQSVIKMHTNTWIESCANILTEAQFSKSPAATTTQQQPQQNTWGSAPRKTRAFGTSAAATSTGPALSTEAKEFKDTVVAKLATVELKRVDDSVQVVDAEQFKNDYAGCQTSFRLPHLMQYRTKNGITIICGTWKIQVILRLYNSISEIIHGFDIGSSAVAFNGNEVYLTSLSKLSYMYKINVVDTTRRSTTYERRLRKYFDRGFAIVFPNLDITKLRVRNLKWAMNEVCDMPYLTFAYRGISSNCIFFERWLYSGHAEVMGDESSCDYAIDELDPYRAAHLNITSLVRGKDNYFWLVKGWDKTVLDMGPHISARMIHNSYSQLRRTIWKDGRLNVKAIQEFINIKSLPEICNEIFADNVNLAKRREILVNLVEQQTVVTIELYNKSFNNVDHRSLSWIIENPMTQLTSSINPIVEDPANYYGEYYKANW